MIYKKIPAINNELISEALKHKPKPKQLREARSTYNFWMRRHKREALQNPRREESLWELISLYYYLVDTKVHDRGYTPYFETMEEMLFRNGLITDYKSGYPINQFINRSIERFVAQAIKEIYPKDKVKVYESHGKQDKGIDFIWNDKNIDVKSSKHYSYVEKHYRLGSIKSYALNDPTKKTDSIIWTGNLVHLGYICIIGMEDWSQIKTQIKNNEWNVRREDEFNLSFYNKKISDFDRSKKFPKAFLGGISEATKTEMIKAYDW